MARKPRIEYPGAVYHIMSRGNRGEDIFRDDQDRHSFLDTLSEACDRCGWLIHAYALMNNHYHLLLETPESNMVVGMHWLQGTYTRRFNVRHHLRGHVLQGRYKALVVEADRGNYFSQAANYIHLNPVRSGLIRDPQGALTQYSWSSLPAYLHSQPRPPWLVAQRTLGNLGLEDNDRGLSLYGEHLRKLAVHILQQTLSEEDKKAWSELTSGWCLGGEAFRERMKKHASEQIALHDRRSYAGEAALFHDQVAAEGMVQEAMHRLGISEEHLDYMRKGDVRKQVLAWWVRRSSCVRNDWIASRLKMGRGSNLSRMVRQVEMATSGAASRMKEMIKKED